MVEIKKTEHGLRFAFVLKPRPDSQLPWGLIELHVPVTGKTDVESSYMRVSHSKPGIGAPRAKVRGQMFEDGQVVIDRDTETGEIVGLELLEFRSSSEYAELQRYARTRDDRERSLLECMLASSLHLWFVLKIAIKHSVATNPHVVRLIREQATLRSRFKQATTETVGAPAWLEPSELHLPTPASGR